MAGETSICKGCGKKIKWIKTEKGKDMTVDPEIATVITEKGKTIRGFIPHWATCPEAKKFRKANNIMP